jgi:hypothetical protein
MALLTSFNACPLGLQLARTLPSETILLVSPDAPDYLERNPVEKTDKRLIPFTASMDSVMDRGRLIAYLLAENIKLTHVVHNQPFLMKPTEKEKRFDLNTTSAR